MSKIYLISTAYIKDNSTVNLNVEDTLLKNGIIEGQKIQLQQTLGKSLYDKIVQLVEDDEMGESINIHYKELLDDYIQPALVYHALYNAIPFLNFKVNNKNIGQQNSDNTESVDLNTVKYITSVIKDKGEFLAQRTTEFIKVNITYFPEYLSSANCNYIHPSQNNYSSGMVL